MVSLTDVSWKTQTREFIGKEKYSIITHACLWFHTFKVVGGAGFCQKAYEEYWAHILYNYDFNNCATWPPTVDTFLRNDTITVLVLIKLTKFAVALQLRCGFCKLIFWHYFIIFRKISRTLYIVWSLVRRRVTRRLTRLQTMCNALRYRKIL